MKTKNLTDEQIYNLLLSQKLPFVKQEHFERFLKTASEEDVLLYFSNFGYAVGEDQHIAFVQSVSVETLRKYLGVAVSKYYVSSKIMMEVVARGDHEAIMLLIRNGRVDITADVIVSIIKRNNVEEVEKLLLHCIFSAEAKIALLEFDRLNNTHEIRRFYDYFERLPEEVELALVKEGEFSQIKHYFATKWCYNANLGKYISINSEKVLSALLKRGDIFERLVKEAPHLEILCDQFLMKEASHEQLMLWLSKHNVFGKETFSLLVARKNIDELLGLKNHFNCILMSDSDISNIISLGKEILVRWLLEDFSSAYLKEDHACQILENGWHHLFRELIVSAKNKLNAVEMISAVIKAGNEEDMLCVFNRIGKFDPNCYSLLISSGNTKWIEMYRKHFCLPAIHF